MKLGITLHKNVNFRSLLHVSIRKNLSRAKLGKRTRARCFGSHVSIWECFLCFWLSRCSLVTQIDTFIDRVTRASFQLVWWFPRKWGCVPFPSFRLEFRPRTSISSSNFPSVGIVVKEWCQKRRVNCRSNAAKLYMLKKEHFARSKNHGGKISAIK